MEFKNELPDNILDDHNADISNNDPDDIHAEVPVNTMADLSEYIVMREKEKPPSLIKSIIERLNGN